MLQGLRGCLISPLADYEMTSCQLLRPAPSGAHERRPYEWLIE